LQDAFAVLFFMSVGMLFDPGILVRQPLAVLAVGLLIVFGKPLQLAIVLARGYRDFKRHVECDRFLERTPRGIAGILLL
jgi:predicted Kef-type K+ transport protein